MHMTQAHMTQAHMTQACPTRSGRGAAEPQADAGQALAALISGSDILLPLLTQVRRAVTARPTSVPVSHPTTHANWAPPGYEEIDRRVLDWIASHRAGRRARPRGLA
jgi:hypothetical protein